MMSDAGVTYDRYLTYVGACCALQIMLYLMVGLYYKEKFTMTPFVLLVFSSLAYCLSSLAFCLSYHADDPIGMNASFIHKVLSVIGYIILLCVSKKTWYECFLKINKKSAKLQ